jgi:uncharacterized OB-fold protein
MVEQEGKKRVPIMEGWFTVKEGKAHLIGNQCQACGDYFFPTVYACRNPGCRSKGLREVLLSRTGKLWSFTVGYYLPPPPYRPIGTFAPYGLAVVELPREKLMILGQMGAGIDSGKLRIGMDMEMVLETLQEDPEGNEVIAWKWRPL